MSPQASGGIVNFEKANALGTSTNPSLGFRGHLITNFPRVMVLLTINTPLRGCLYGGLDFTSCLHGISQVGGAGSLSRVTRVNYLTTFIFPRNPESDICVQVFILYPTHKQTELVK